MTSTSGRRSLLVMSYLYQLWFKCTEGAWNHCQKMVPLLVFYFVLGHCCLLKDVRHMPLKPAHFFRNPDFIIIIWISSSSAGAGAVDDALTRRCKVHYDKFIHHANWQSMATYCSNKSRKKGSFALKTTVHKRQSFWMVWLARKKIETTALVSVY